MSTSVSINGSLCTVDTARVSVMDRGFLYGDGVFEVLRTWHGVPFAMEDHLGRLYRSASRIGISMPIPLGSWVHETREVLKASGEGERVIRWMITRGEGAGVDPSQAGAPTRVIWVEDLKEAPREIYEKGVRVITIPSGIAYGRATILGAKSANYLWNILATRAAREQGAHEAIFTGEGSRVLEGASSNVFCFVDGRMITPAVCDGILAGITRAWVLDAARALSMECAETMMTESDLLTADEVFLTSSVRELVPVVGVNDHEVGDGRPGWRTRALHKRVRELGGVRTAMPWE